MTPGRAPGDPRPPWGEVGIHGIHRDRVWDEVATVEATLPGDELTAVVLGDDVVVEVGPADVSLEPLVRSVTLAPPFRIEARRRSGELWVVGARAIRVVELDPALRGDDLELAFDGRERSVRIDGSPTFAGVPELERLGALAGPPYVVRATRLAGRAWEVEVSRL